MNIIVKNYKNWFIGWKFDQFATFDDFRTLFYQGTDDQEWMKMVMNLILIQLQSQDKNYDVSTVSEAWKMR